MDAQLICRNCGCGIRSFVTNPNATRGLAAQSGKDRGGFSARRTARPGAAGSIRLYACKLEHLGPFFDFPRDHASELGGRAAERRVAEVGQARLELWIGETGIDLSV